MTNQIAKPQPDLAIIFDFGGVLIDWNPHAVYQDFFNGDRQAIDRFLSEIGFMEWNAHQDAGRPFAEGVADLCARFPHYCELIRAYDTDWEKCITAANGGTVKILDALRQAGYDLYGLSNFSIEKFQLVRRRFEFFDWFCEIMLSAEVRLVKPDPRIFSLLLERMGRPAHECILIDDSAPNIKTAREMGFHAIHFQSPAQLQGELAQLGVL